MSNQCLISFGSNLGDRDRVIAEAARAVFRSGVTSDSSLQTSRLFETPPIGGPGGQSAFLNAVAVFQTEAPASEILDLLQRTEIELGRKRHDRWGARSIDLDVVLYGHLNQERVPGQRGLIGGRGPAGSQHALVVPHPRYTARRFVVAPACDVAAELCDPRFGWSIRDLAEHLDAEVPSMALVGGDESMRSEICQRLSREHGIEVLDSVALQRQSTPSVPWITQSLPSWMNQKKPDAEKRAPGSSLPRLIGRIQRTTAQTRWPAPHEIWPSSGNWPEYRLEVDDLDWAIGEIASALDSMQCPLTATTDDGNWW